jgi:hypothetical protein
MLKIITALFLVIGLAGCQSTQITKGEAFPKMYTEKPISILVVPAVNLTTAADAAALYATTIAKPLAESGYYVFSIPFTEKFLQREGIVDGDQVSNIPLEKFKTMFGADAVLFVTLNSWDTNYYVTGGNVTVGAKFSLKSTTSNQILWQYDDVVVHNTSGNSGNILADIIATAISTAIVDYVPIAHVVNQRIVNSMPVGKYHKRYNADGKDPGIFASKVIETAVVAKPVATTTN